MMRICIASGIVPFFHGHYPALFFAALIIVDAINQNAPPKQPPEPDKSKVIFEGTMTISNLTLKPIPKPKPKPKLAPTPRVTPEPMIVLDGNGLRRFFGYVLTGIAGGRPLPLKRRGRPSCRRTLEPLENELAYFGVCRTKFQVKWAEVDHFEGDMAPKAAVDDRSRQVDHQADSGQRTPALDPSGDAVLGFQVDFLAGLRQEVPWMFSIRRHDQAAVGIGRRLFEISLGEIGKAPFRQVNLDFGSFRRQAF